MDLKFWQTYFRKNRNHFSDIHWAVPDFLTETERRLITPSIQQFQKGENSEGRHFYDFSKSFPDPLYLHCVELFIKEEQTHAKVLGQFMEKHQIPKLCRHWVDDCFRWLRKLSGLENTVAVLVTAEIIAKVYYQALRNCTSSLLLKKICAQILKDEDQHIIFQCSALAHFYPRKNLAGKFFTRTSHLTLMMGAVLIVWMYHRKVLIKGDFGFVHFFSETLSIFIEAEKIIRNKRIVAGKFFAPAV